MSEPTMPARTHPLLRPRVFFPILTLIVIAGVLLSPQTEVDEQMAPTTHSHAARGTSGLLEITRRLGWNAARLEQPMTGAADTNTLYMVFAPSGMLSIAESRWLLDAVERGASAMMYLAGGTIEDSLHFTTRDRSGYLIRSAADTTGCEPGRQRGIRVRAVFEPFLTDIAATAPIRHDTVHLATMRPNVYRPRDTPADSASDSALRVVRDRALAPQPVIVGIKRGRGRIALISETRMVGNDYMRVCKWGLGVSVVRTMEWLSTRDSMPSIKRVVFDEYHLGFGERASVARTIRRWLSETPPGRALALLIIAGFVLILALAPRPIAPVGATTIARRSPLEHVGALAHAYEQARATRTAARRLVQGIRRRTARTLSRRSLTEEQFLQAVAQRTPELSADTTRLIDLLARQGTPAELVDAAESADRIERSLRT